MEEERQTTAQKSSHGSVPVEVDTNFIFQCPRRDDGGMGVVSEKCRCCFLHRNTPEIKNMYPKEEAEVVGGEPVCAPPRNAPNHQANSTQKFLEKNNMVLMPRPPYSRDLASCDFSPKLKLALKGQHLGDLEGIKLKTTAYLGSIPKSEFKKCYDDWLLRLRKCIATQWENFVADKINL